jgi:methionyl-tRNA synthetase
MGFDVFFNSGTDEHGMKIAEAAAKNGQTPQEYTDGYAEKFKDYVKYFGLDASILHLVRTTDESHIKAAQEFWRRCNDNGYIYKKNYQRKYCVGCEEEKNESELVDGKCAIHPNRELELIDEENYFFKYSAFGEKLLEFYGNNPDFVIPETRMREVKSFVEGGLQDFSISRLKAKMSWGIEVPGDAEHVMYVWFDALTNYISTLGWPNDMENFERYWVNGEATQYCGKDNTRFQAIMWQAMLMAANVPNSKRVVVNGFITAEGGVKMSKSLGNSVDPIEIVNDYGTDALRYFVLRELSPFEDSPFSKDRFKEAYNSGLANGLGNLVSRVMKMATSYGVDLTLEEKETVYYTDATESEHLKKFDIKAFAEEVWAMFQNLDKYIQVNEPFKKIKVNEEEGKEDVHYLLLHLFEAVLKLEPLLPETSRKIQELIKANKSPEVPLFARKD